MINKSVFEDQLISGMQDNLQKQASNQTPDLIKAANCLHTALEIFEEIGSQKQADQLLKLLHKIAQHHTTTTKPVEQLPSVKSLMEAGLTQKDLMEFSKNNPVAKAKVNLVLRTLGLSEHQIARFIGPANVMSEEDAKAVADPNRSFGKMWNWMKDPTTPTDPSRVQPGETLQFESVANDRATKGLTPEKMVANLKNHGTEFNLADVPPFKRNLDFDDMEADFADLLNADTFDLNASDDDLLGLEVAPEDDLLQVSDQEAFSDFEDEKN